MQEFFTKFSRLSFRMPAICSPFQSGQHLWSLLVSTLLLVGCDTHGSRNLPSVDGSEISVESPSEPYFHDFGIIRPRAMVEHEFNIQNPSGSPVRIVSVDSDCSCAAAIPSGEVISARGNLPVRVQLNAPAGSGTIVKRIRLQLSDDKGTLLLSLRATVRPTYFLQPEKITVRADSAVAQANLYVFHALPNSPPRLDDSACTYQAELRAISPEILPIGALAGYSISLKSKKADRLAPSSGEVSQLTIELPDASLQLPVILQSQQSLRSSTSAINLGSVRDRDRVSRTVDIYFDEIIDPDTLDVQIQSDSQKGDAGAWSCSVDRTSFRDRIRVTIEYGTQSDIPPTPGVTHATIKVRSNAAAVGNQGNGAILTIPAFLRLLGDNPSVR